MTRQQFEKLVNDAVDGLPEEFRNRLNNVDFVVEQWPSKAHINAAKIHPRSLLFGLYQGTPLTQRTQGSILPDKITIFAGPIFYVSRSPEDVKKNVTRVVKHEIAHHFGMDEHSIRKRGH